MTAHAWRMLCANWKLPLTPALCAQRFVAGPLFSGLNWMQGRVTTRRRLEANLSNCIVILGYWRSGTTLLHEYLSLDGRYGFPSTYSCMNPQHFMLTQASAVRAGASTVVRRPMDEVEISAISPQEDEFALLALGARSPYEGLLVPSRLPEALKLGDPVDLAPEESRHWRRTFEYFLRGVAATEGNRPLVLKSPPHGYRVPVLRETLPNARFIVLVRSPLAVFESAVRMWRSLCQLYALGPLPPEDQTRWAVLEDRPVFEGKLTAGLAGLPANRLAVLRYESLTRDPIASLARLYEQLELDGFPGMRAAVEHRMTQSSPYRARNAQPPALWRDRVETQWRPIFERYGYETG